MWVLRWFVAAIIILLILGFALQNNEKQMAVVFIKGVYETDMLPIWIIVYASFALGMIFWLFFSIFQVFGLKAQIRKMRNDNLRIQKELNNLRNLSIEDEIEVKAIPEQTSASNYTASPVQTEEREDA
ncbi:MAG: lipopolysaccharide assembly LapA domain-containing protein [bacterium]